MISGFASPEGTRSRIQAHPDLAHVELGVTGLMVSQAGFGCYRVTTGIVRHKSAMEKALTEGINLIDTSTNYADGGSETLVGQVLTNLVETGALNRKAVVIVSKVGYLQGKNYEYSRQRIAQGKPFKDLVDFGEGLAHCIHPEFLEDQLSRSLERLNLETLDFYLLHNPEYYLEWAMQQHIDAAEARLTYENRIRTAFEFMEEMVRKGRIRHYGVSSNTFVSEASHPEFTCLDTLWRIARSISESHHFRLVQFPFNLLEPGAALEKNQPEGKSVLELASQLNLAVLINRPLNAFDGRKLLRLADVRVTRQLPVNEILQRIRLVARSEKSFVRGYLPELQQPITLQNRIKEQLAIGDILKHHWRNFGSFERWRDVKTGNILPRVRGVMEFLAPYEANLEGLADWTRDHMNCLQTALTAVESIYAEPAALEARRISAAVAAADPDWASPETLSQKAVCALRSTTGVSCVLVGMRRERYVSDVLSALRLPISPKPREASWKRLSADIPADRT